MFGAGGVRKYERQVDLCILHERELFFGLFRRLLDPLEGQFIQGSDDLTRLPEFIDNPVQDPEIEILTT